MNYASILEAGIVARLDALLDCRVVGYHDIGTPNAKSYPAVSVVCSPAQDWQGMLEISVRVNAMTNALEDTDRTALDDMLGHVQEALSNDDSEEVNALVAEPVHFAGLGPWSESEADVLETEQETTNVASLSCTAYCVVDVATTTTTTTTTTA